MLCTGIHDVLKKIENAGDDEGKPAVTVKIVNSGELHDGMKSKFSRFGFTCQSNFFFVALAECVTAHYCSMLLY